MASKRKRIKLFIDRTLSGNTGMQLFILLSIMVALFALSFLLLSITGNSWKTYCDDKGISKFFFPLYLLIDSNAFSNLYTNTEIDISVPTAIVACIVYILGIIVFTGMIISTLTNIIERRVEQYRQGHILYLTAGHYVIMGYDDIVPSIITSILNIHPDTDILLLTALDARIAHERLQRSLTDEQMEHLFINYGQRTSTASYKDIHLEDAIEIFVAGQHDRDDHDARNVKCINSISKYFQTLGERTFPKRITCVFESLDTYKAFQTTKIFTDIAALGIEFMPYNVHVEWARQILLKRTYQLGSDTSQSYPYPTLYGDSAPQSLTTADTKRVHIVFVGTSNAAVATAIEAAHILHFTNFGDDGTGIRTRITFIELNADKEMAMFITSHRNLFDIQPYYYMDMSDSNTEYAEHEPTRYSDTYSSHSFLDTEFEFIKGDIFNKNIQRMLDKWSASGKEYLSIFLATANQKTNFTMGMNMPDKVYENNVPIFIRIDNADAMVTNLRLIANKDFPYHHSADGETKTLHRKGRYANIYPFGMTDTAFLCDEELLMRAKIINYLYETDFPEKSVLCAMSRQSIVKDAEKRWLQLAVSLRWSNMYSAASIAVKLDILKALRNELDASTEQLTEQEVEKLAIVEHNRWNMEKLLMGYRKAMPYEDKYPLSNPSPLSKEDARDNKDNHFIHCDIRPYKELDNVRRYDKKICSYIPWIIDMARL